MPTSAVDSGGKYITTWSRCYSGSPTKFNYTCYHDHSMCTKLEGFTKKYPSLRYVIVGHCITQDASYSGMNIDNKNPADLYSISSKSDKVGRIAERCGNKVEKGYGNITDLKESYKVNLLFVDVGLSPANGKKFVDKFEILKIEFNNDKKNDKLKGISTSQQYNWRDIKFSDTLIDILDLDSDSDSDSDSGLEGFVHPGMGIMAYQMLFSGERFVKNTYAMICNNMVLLMISICHTCSYHVLYNSI